MKNTDLPCTKCGAVDYYPGTPQCRPCAQSKARTRRAKKKAEDPVAYVEYCRANVAKFRDTFEYQRRVWLRRRRRYLRDPSTNRRRQLAHCTPPWLTRDQRVAMRRVYQQARDYSELSGETYHVDHIVPLCGKTVSGLHVPWNLRVVRAIDNIRKSNRTDHLNAPHALGELLER